MWDTSNETLSLGFYFSKDHHKVLLCLKQRSASSSQFGADGHRGGGRGGSVVGDDPVAFSPARQQSPMYGGEKRAVCGLPSKQDLQRLRRQERRLTLTLHWHTRPRHVILLLTHLHVTHSAYSHTSTSSPHYMLCPDENSVFTTFRWSISWLAYIESLSTSCLPAYSTSWDQSQSSQKYRKHS